MLGSSLAISASGLHVVELRDLSGKLLARFQGGAGSSSRHARYLPDRELTGTQAGRRVFGLQGRFASPGAWLMAPRTNP